MAIITSISADWDQDGFACFEAAPGDPLNLVLTPLLWTDWARSASAGGSISVSQGGIDEDYGYSLIEWTSGTNVAAYVQCGGSLDSITSTLSNSSPYTLIFYVKSTDSAWDAINMQVAVRNASNVLLQTSSAFVVTEAEGWKKIVVAFSTAASGSGMFFQFGKVSSATSVLMHVTGMMVVDGTYTSSNAPGLNMGVASNLYDNLFPYAIEEEWNVGAFDAYADVADLNTLRLTLNNQSRIFSPENVASPLAGLLSDRFIQIKLASALAEKERVFFGLIQDVQPTPGVTSGPYHAILTATSSRRYWEGKEIKLALQINLRSNQIINNIAGEIDLPPRPTFSFPAADTGTFVYPYAGDNWADGVNALDAASEAAAAERGYLYWDRDDAMRFKNRTWRYDSDDEVSVLSATLDNDFDFMTYDYGADLINEVAVKFYPRKLNGSTTTIWELDETVVLLPLASETITARFRSDKDNRFKVGAINVAVGTNTVLPSGGITKTLTPYSNSCEILMENPSASVTRTQSVLTLTGQEIRDFNPNTVRAEDASSIAAYGRKTMQLDNKMVNAKADAKQIRDLELARHKDPRGHVRSITITNKNAAREQLIVQLTVGMKIRVIEDQTQHDGYYIIMGEQHQTKNAHLSHEVTYFLEPAVALI